MASYLLRSLVLALCFALCATPLWADIAVQAGSGRDKSTLEMISLFNRESSRDEWLTFDLHAGRIQRQRKARAEVDPLGPNERGEKWEAFPFYGIDMRVGHTSLNPYNLLILGVSRFERLTNRLGTPWNFHVGLEFGVHGPEFGWFLAAHHWSNGPQITAAPGPNDGEEFAAFGVEWRF